MRDWVAEEQQRMTFAEFAKDVFRRYPGEAALITLLLALASAMEILGLATVIPIMGSLVGGAQVTDGTVFRIIHSFGIDRLHTGMLLAVMSGLMIGRTALLFVSEYIGSRLGVMIEKNFRISLAEKVFRAKWSFRIRQNTGVLCNLITGEADKTETAIRYLGLYLIDILFVGIFTLSTALVSWKTLALTALVASPIVFLMRYVNRRTREVAHERIRQANICSHAIIENLNMSKFIKASAYEDGVMHRFRRVAEGLARCKVLEALYRTIVKDAPECVAVIVVVLLIFVGTRYHLVSSADILFTLLLVYRVSMRVGSLQNSKRTTLANMPGYDVCRKLEDGAAASAEATGKTPMVELSRDIQYRDVAFSYDTGSEVLHGVQVQIPKNQTVAFVGRSGSGKTTMVDLLLGLMPPTRGALAVDDVDMRDLDIASWRRVVGYVPQEADLFSGSIQENIIRDVPAVTEEAMLHAARLAHVHEFVQSLPKGYETVVGDRGIMLSGGQKQRIALARVLVRNPQVLVLDEATSALDNESEKCIHDAILQLRHNITIVLVAHRLTTVTSADIIYVMESGRVVEQGRYEELLQRQGAFYRMHQAVSSRRHQDGAEGLVAGDVLVWGESGN